MASRRGGGQVAVRRPACSRPTEGSDAAHQTSPGCGCAVSFLEQTAAG
ncbi:hypothetical protein [Actinomyces sp. MRS3W]|nr:hypothetical protein [Actinomyces sp. MRS3W]MDU0347571.1 hypothetical protein [Actinomyces sp. MRS3W]